MYQQRGEHSADTARDGATTTKGTRQLRTAERRAVRRSSRALVGHTAMKISSRSATRKRKCRSLCCERSAHASSAHAWQQETCEPPLLRKPLGCNGRFLFTAQPPHICLSKRTRNGTHSAADVLASWTGQPACGGRQRARGYSPRPARGSRRGRASTPYRLLRTGGSPQGQQARRRSTRWGG